MTTFRLIIINCVAFLAIILLWLLSQAGVVDFSTITDFFAVSADAATVIRHPWTLITYMFAHLDFLHLLINMLWLGWFGCLYRGSGRRLCLLYLGGGLAGALSYLIYASAFTTDLPDGILVGSSAAVIAIVAATTILSPNRRVKLIFIGEIKLKWIAPVVLLTFFCGMTASNAAHLGGLTAGAAVAVVRRIYEYHSSRIALEKARQRTMRMALIEKARRSGFSSLSEAERRDLFDMSHCS